MTEPSYRFEGPATAIDAILEDHEEIRRLLVQFEQAWDLRSRLSLAEAVLEELVIHTTVKEEVFYPELRARMGQDSLERIESGNREIKLLIAELEGMADYDGRYEACFARLSERVRDHFQSETSELLPRASGLLLDGKGLGLRMARLKEQLLAQLRNPRLETVLEGNNGV